MIFMLISTAYVAGAASSEEKTAAKHGGCVPGGVVRCVYSTEVNADGNPKVKDEAESGTSHTEVAADGAVLRVHDHALSGSETHSHATPARLVKKAVNAIRRNIPASNGEKVLRVQQHS